MNIAKKFGLTHSLLNTVREVVAAEGKVKEYGVDTERRLAAQRKRMIRAPKKVMVAKGKGGGVEMISKSKYNPKKHVIASSHDPVGREDADVNNDGKVDAQDRYLKARRRAIAAKLKSKKQNETSEVKITGKKEKIEMKPKLSEDVDQIDETMTRKHFQQVADVIKAHPDQEKRNELAKHHAEIFKKSNPRFDHSRFYKAANAKIVHNEEVEQIDEREMTSAEMKKREKIAKAMKPISGWEKRYPGRGKAVMYATATKQAMKK